MGRHESSANGSFPGNFSRLMSLGRGQHAEASTSYLRHYWLSLSLVLQRATSSSACEATGKDAAQADDGNFTPCHNNKVDVEAAAVGYGRGGRGFKAEKWFYKN
jgi:hypothetical protein